MSRVRAPPLVPTLHGLVGPCSGSAPRGSAWLGRAPPEGPGRSCIPTASRLRPDCIAATESAMMENAPRGPLLARHSLSFPPQGKRAILRSPPAGIAAVLRAKLAQRKKLLDSRDDEEAEGTAAQDTWETQP